MLASNISSTALIGLAGAAYATGISVYDYEWSAAVVLVFFCVFLGLFPRLARLPLGVDRPGDARLEHLLNGAHRACRRCLCDGYFGVRLRMVGGSRAGVLLCVPRTISSPRAAPAGRRSAWRCSPRTSPQRRSSGLPALPMRRVFRCTTTNGRRQSCWCSSVCS